MTETADTLDNAPPDNLLDLIDQLQQPMPPDPVSMWPQTMGWAVLGGLVLVGLAVAAGIAWRHWRANAYRRAALAQVQAAQGDPAQIAAIVRRCALAVWPRAQVAGLHGPAWIAFLETTGGTTVPDSAAAALLTGPYRVRPAPLPELGAWAATWIRGHRVGRAPW